jgi:hypothetical protein
LKAVRRLLEEDLSLNKKALDVHKKYIEALIDQVCTSTPAAVLTLRKAWLVHMGTSVSSPL